jgi:hypothetical protein
VGANDQAWEFALRGQSKNRRNIFFHESSVARPLTRDNFISSEEDHLQREIPKEQVQKLITTCRTDCSREFHFQTR